MPSNHAWYDNMLDLYNYAGVIGDTCWQHGILGQLKNAVLPEEENYDSFSLHLLLQQYESVNAQLAKLHQKLLETKDRSKAEQLRVRVWRLKLRRLEITKRIYTGWQQADRIL